MTTSMQRLLSRVDGTPPLVAPTSILNVPRGADEPSRSHRSPVSCMRSDWMGGRVPREIERLALTEPTEVSADLRAAGLM